MQTILVPLDGSATAESVLPVVMPIATRHHAHVILVAVHEPAIPGRSRLGVPAIDPRTDDEARESMCRYLKEVAGRLPTGGCAVDTVVLEGAPSEQLAACAARVRADLLTLASHGRGGLSRVWLGSVTDQLVRHAEVPMLVVQARAQRSHAAAPTPPRRVVIPLDGSPEAEAIFDPAIELAGDHPTEFVLLRVATTLSPVLRAISTAAEFERDTRRQYAEAAAYLGAAARRFAARRTPVRWIVRTAPEPAAEILSAAAELDADVIALTTHGAGVVGRALMGGIADAVTRGSPVPVLLKRVTRTSGLEPAFPVRLFEERLATA